MKTVANTTLMLIAGLFADSVSAADRHLDDLAFRLKQQAAQACREVRYGFRRTAAYPHLYKDFYELYTLADHIHDVSHHNGDLRHLKDDTEQLDDLFHHTEELTAQTGTVRIAEPGGAYQTVPACGSTASTYHLRRLQVLMGQMEETIHHLQDDLDAELAPAGGVPPLPPSQVSPALPVVPPNPGYLPPSGKSPNPLIPQGQGGVPQTER